MLIDTCGRNDEFPLLEAFVSSSVKIGTDSSKYGKVDTFESTY
jgi:hypothetical protein